MENKNLILQELNHYNEDERFYRDYYFAKQSPETLQKFLSAHTTEEIKSRRLICPELYKENHTFFPEERFFKLEHGRNIWIEKHNRYSPMLAHIHEYFEIFYILKGSCEHTLHKQTTILPQGTLCLIAPYVSHSVGVFDDSIILNIMIQRSTFEEYFFNDLRSQNILVSFFLSNLYATDKISSLIFEINDEDLVELLLTMLLEEVVEDSYTYRLLNHYMSIFFTRLVRKYGKAQANYSVDTCLNEKALTIINYIHNNYQDITLEEVAKHFHYTNAHCSRLIKSITGHNFVTLLRNMRLKRAESMLGTSPASIEDISYAVGYENAATFIKLFKKQYGITPGKYRQQLSGDNKSRESEKV